MTTGTRTAAPSERPPRGRVFVRVRSWARLFGGLGLVALIALGAPPIVRGAGPAVGVRERTRLLATGQDALSSARTLLQRKRRKPAARRLAEAKAAFERLLTSDPGDAEAAVGMSQVLYLGKHYEQGIALLRPLAEAHPDNLELAHQLGLHLYRHGDRAEAVGLLSKVAQDPRRFDAMWLLATHFYKQADWAKGLPFIVRYHDVRPEDTRALGLLATYYLKLGRLEDAIEAYDGFLAAHPKDTRAQLNRANALFRLGRFAEAGAAYEGLLARSPKSARVLFNLASVRIRQARCQDAVPLLDRFLGLQPKHASALYFRAECLLKLGRLADAKAAFQQAGRAAPSNPWVPYNLSKLAWREGRRDEATREALRACEVGAKDWEILTWAGTVLRRTDRAAEALTWHDKAVALVPKEPAVHEERGRDLWTLGRPGDAAAAFQAALALDPKRATAVQGYAAARTGQAIAARRAGDVEGARAHLMAALERAPDYTPAKANLALLELSQGHTEAAAAAVRGLQPGDDPDLAAVLAFVSLSQGHDAAASKALEHAKGTHLTSLAKRTEAALAARAGDWDRAAAAYAAAVELEPSAQLRQAATLAALHAGLEHLARGEARKARALLDAIAPQRTQLTSAADRAKLALARAALAVQAAPTSPAAAKALRALLKSRKLAGSRWASARDAGLLYLAWGALKRKEPKQCLKALKRLSSKVARGEVAAALARTARDALGRRAYHARRWARAVESWRAIEPPSPATLNNLGAALFRQGDSAGAQALWERKGASAEALYNRAVLADRAGRYAEALELLEAYVRAVGPKAKDAAARLRAKRRALGLGKGAGGGR